MTAFLSVAMALLAGLLMTRLMNIFKLPDVTAYLIAGLLIGPYCLGRLGIPGIGFPSLEAVTDLDFISDAALGFIAFAIGNEFRLSQLKKTGKQATVIGILQAVVTMIIVDIALVLSALFIFKDTLSVPAAITIGSIATATAPAATLMVVKQYKAHGRLTDILLPVVALDDAVGLAAFAVSFGIARAMTDGNLDLVSIIVNPLVEIILSLVLGSIFGLILTFIEKFFHSNRNRTSLIIGIVLTTVGLSMLEFHIGSVKIGFSSLLVCMMLGTVFCNRCPLSEEMMDRADRWTAPVLTLFFVISGASLNLSVFSDFNVVIIGILYIIFRCLGKYVGAYFSASITKCEDNVKKYLGITLFPQAGVALGMCVSAELLGADGIIIKNIILFSVLVYELIGPLLTKMALTKSGDIVNKGDEAIKRRDRAAKTLKEKV